MNEIELNNKVTDTRNYFESVCNTDEMKSFHQAICKNFNIDRVFTIEDVMYLLYENNEIVAFAIKNFSDNVSVMAAINYNNTEKEYYKFINENY